MRVETGALGRFKGFPMTALILCVQISVDLVLRYVGSGDGGAPESGGRRQSEAS